MSGSGQPSPTGPDVDTASGLKVSVLCLESVMSGSGQPSPTGPEVDTATVASR